MRPYSTAGARRYCRLFPPSQNRPLPATAEYSKYLEALKGLALVMTDNGTGVCDHRPDYRIPAGYTYFGQFVDHDLTNDPTSLDEALELRAEEIENGQEPKLDLGHLYGRGPQHDDSSFLYESDKMRLLVGPPGSFDVAVSANGRALVADKRAKENLVLRQMTAVFARLHNAAVEQFRGIRDDVRRFERARLQTTWQFQWLVYGDYLSRVLDPSVYESIFMQRRPLVHWSIFSIPVEFSVAAMRFGHSMVRETYQLSGITDATLLQLTGESQKPGNVKPEFAIDWARFFPGGRVGPTTAMPIDTRITATLHKLPEHSLRLFNPGNKDKAEGEPFSLPFHTMKRGAAQSLASGQFAARGFGFPPLTETELTCNCEEKVTMQGDFLQKHDLVKETPLWYYILKECEVKANGNRLGPTGSQIVAETMFAALMSDANSFLNHPDADRQPPVWTFAGEQKRFVTVGSLFDEAARFLL